MAHKCIRDCCCGLVERAWSIDDKSRGIAWSLWTTKDSGYPGERAALKIDCDCRKPRIGLVERALRELPIDLARSAVFGDSNRDAELASRLGIQGFLVQGGETLAHSTMTPFPDLASAVDAWLNGGRGPLYLRLHSGLTKARIV